MAAAVFLLSALISLTCAALLLRSFGRSRSGLLLWAGICFTGLSVNNLLLFLDEVADDVDLSSWRTAPALAGMLALVFGLIWEEIRT
jgi:Family of unknown function (DUF5985)